jgi:hypothetical protein
MMKYQVYLALIGGIEAINLNG